MHAAMAAVGCGTEAAASEARPSNLQLLHTWLSQSVSVSFKQTKTGLSSLILTCSQPASAESGLASAEDEVFRQAYIPRRLGEVADHERDYDRLTGESTLSVLLGLSLLACLYCSICSIQAL